MCGTAKHLNVMRKGAFMTYRYAVNAFHIPFLHPRLSYMYLGIFVPVGQPSALILLHFLPCPYSGLCTCLQLCLRKMHVFLLQYKKIGHLQ